MADRADQLPLGARGEAVACRYLEAKGLRVLTRNYRTRSGEVDIVARDGEVTVFVEVKERQDAEHGEGYEAVTIGKRRRVIRAAQSYAATHGLWEARLRFDVVSIDWSAGAPSLRHDEGAFDSQGR
ncbi:MAG TPA: YraN family protein [Vicinamibacteria bacterium]|nr:YraN family protein [Vicinamibacteria bacterium]